MALTPAEKQRQYRERQRQKKARERKEARESIQEHVRKPPTPDQTWTIPSEPFVEFINDARNHQTMMFVFETLESIGAQLTPAIGEGGDPQWHENNWNTPYRGELGRAERIAGGFLDIARELFELINTYKLREIDRAIAELSDAKLTTKAAREKALSDAVRLNELRKQLTKEVRHSFHQTTVKGEGDQTA